MQTAMKSFVAGTAYTVGSLGLEDVRAALIADRQTNGALGQDLVAARRCARGERHPAKVVIAHKRQNLCLDVPLSLEFLARWQGGKAWLP